MTAYFRVHSAGLMRNGHGVLFAGRNGAGKSTLVTRLISEGFFLFSDDEIWIEHRTLLLHSPRTAVFLRNDAWDLFPQYRDRFTRCNGDAWRLNPEDIAQDCRAVPSPAWGIIFLQPASGPLPLLTGVGQTEALSCLFDQCMNFADFGESGLALLVKLIRRVELFRLSIGNLDECARIISQVLP